MSLYCAATPGPTTFSWTPAADTASSVGLSVQAYAGDPVYFRCLIAKGLYDRANGWVSYARRIDNGYPKTKLRVLTNQPAANAGNAAVYLVFREYNAVAQLPATGGGQFELTNVPVNTAATIFALYAAGGKLYLGQQSVLLQNNQTYSVNLTERSAADVAAEARHLP